MHYYDIHTHHTSQSPSVTVIENLIPGQPVPESFFSAGIHPWYAKDASVADLQKYIPNPKCVAIGECGLDSIKSSLSANDQEMLLRAHLEMARKLTKPVILHVVRSSNVLFQILRDFSDLTYIWHGFTGNAELVKMFGQFNMYCSAGPRGLRKPEIWLSVPVERLLCETDDSGYEIAGVYAKLSEASNIHIEQLAEIIENNVIRIFGHELERKN